MRAYQFGSTWCTKIIPFDTKHSVTLFWCLLQQSVNIIVGNRSLIKSPKHNFSPNFMFSLPRRRIFQIDSITANYVMYWLGFMPYLLYLTQSANWWGWRVEPRATFKLPCSSNFWPREGRNSSVIPKRKLRFPGHQISWGVTEWLIKYAIFPHGLAQQRRSPHKKLAQR